MSSSFRDSVSAKLRTLNPEQIGSFLRTVGQIAGGVTGYAFFGDNAFISALGMIISGALTIWGMWARSDTNLIKSAASVPVVQAVPLFDTGLADSIPDNKVVAASSMRSSALALLLAACLIPLLLSACAQSVARPTPGLPGYAGVIDARIASSDEKVRSYCTALKFAVGLGEWFAQTPQHRVYLQRAQVGVQTYCDQPIVDVRSALIFLANAYENIMRVPGVNAQVVNAKLTIARR